MAINGGYSAFANDESEKAKQLGVNPSETKAPYGSGSGPKYLSHLYHGTDKRSASKIMKTGLKPGRPMKSGEKDHIKQPTAGRVYMSTNYDDAYDYGSRSSNNPAVVKINRNHPSVKGVKEGFKGSGDFYVEHHIPKEALSRED